MVITALTANNWALATSGQRPLASGLLHKLQVAGHPNNEPLQL